MFIKNGINYAPFTGSIINDLDKGVYTVNYIQSNDSFTLSYNRQSFSLPTDLIAIKSEYKDYIMESIKLDPINNIGMLFTGSKGSGKTVMAKQICNELDLPVVIVEDLGYRETDRMFQFLRDINTNVVYLFDEFEKSFTERDQQQKLLTFMDGVYNSTEYRKIFIFTANSEVNIDKNFFSRPSRLRYKIDFDGFNDLNDIRRIFELKLNDNSDETIDRLMEFLKSKTDINLDTILSIIKEVNLFGIDKFIKIGSKIINIDNCWICYHYTRYQGNVIKTLAFDKFINNYKELEDCSFNGEYNTTKTINQLNPFSEFFDGHMIRKKSKSGDLIFLETCRDSKTFYVIDRIEKMSKFKSE